MSYPKPVLNKVLKRSALFLAISTVTAQHSFAGPEGGDVVGGSGSISHSGNNTTIVQNTDRMAIDWQSYDVTADERVQYIQPDSTSVSLNRILSNYGSTIQGRIDANGQVILVNPNGIFFSESSVVNAGGILASGLRLDPSAFMNGESTFKALNGDNGVVINSGLLQASTGGSVNLLGARVENNGLIQAELGTVSLATGREAVLHFDQSGMLGIQITESVLQEELGLDAGVVNNGVIEAAGGKVLLTAAASRDVFSSAVNMGTGEATSVIVDEDGSFTLSTGANVEIRGAIDVSSSGLENAGEVVVLGQNIAQHSRIAADAEEQSGGRIELNAVGTTLLQDGSVLSSQSSGNEGGDIYVLGNQVGLLGNTEVSVSAANGAGEILIGGDYRGENPWVPNASAVYFGNYAQISANANQADVAGRVILWGDDLLRAYGNIEALGFKGADGGFLETSSAWVDLDLSVDTTSENGNSGLWLIDPYDIEITNDASGGVSASAGVFSPANGASSYVTITSLRGALFGGNSVTVQTTDSVGTEPGDIRFQTALDYNGLGNGSLTLTADNNIEINAAIYDFSTGSDSLALTLTAGGSIDVNANITTGGGAFTASGLSFDSQSQTIDTNSSAGGGNVTITTTTGDVDLGTLYVRSPDVGNPILGGGVINVTSGNDLTLHSNFEYHLTGSTDSSGNLTTDYTLTFQASDDIVIDGQIYDSSGNNLDQLNLVFIADSDSNGSGNIDLNANVYTGGGNVTFSGVNFDNTGFVLDTDRNRSGSNSQVSQNGSVSIAMTGTATIEDIISDSDGGSNANIAITGSTVVLNGDIESNGGNLYLYGSSGAANTYTINSGASWSGDSGTNAYINQSANESTATSGGDDTFNINTDIGATIFGGAGDDNFYINSDINAAVSVSGGTGSDDFYVTTGVAATLSGGDDDDNLYIGSSSLNDVSFTFDGGANGLNGDSVWVTDNSYNAQWELTGASSVVIDTDTTGPADAINLTTIENLNGSDGGDDTFSITGAFQGGIDGRGGSDEVQLNTSAGGNWVIDGVDSGTLDANLSFASMESLLGSADATTGNDIFDFEFQSGGVIGAFAGTIDARGGILDAVNVIYDDPADINDIFNVDLDLTSLSLNGVANAEILAGEGDNSSITIAGGAVAATNTTWNIGDFDGAGTVSDGVNDGTVANGANTVTFLNFGDLIGNDANDIFTVTGTIDTIEGGTGADSLQGNTAASTYSLTEVDVVGDGSVLVLGGSVVEDGVATYVNQFIGIEALVGGATADTLQARNTTNTWTIDSANGAESGSLSDGTYSIAFSNIETLNGGSDVDTFNVTVDTDSTLVGGAEDDIFNIADESFTLSLQGGADGTNGDTFNYSGSNTVTWTLTSDTTAGPLAGNLATNISFSGVENLNGGSGQDTLQGANDANAWTVAGADAGTVDGFAFTGMEILNGGSAADTFSVADNAITAVLIGGGTSTTDDTLRYTGTADSRWNIATANTGTFGATGTGNQNVTFSEIENLTGGSGDDDFVFANPGSMSGTVDGGSQASEDVADFSLVTTVNINLQTGLGGVTGIEAITGNGSDSTLTGANGGQAWQVNSDDGLAADGSVGTTNFNDFTVLVGGTGDDTFNLNETTTASISGGAGADEFIVADNSISVSVQGGTGADNDTLNYTGTNAVEWLLTAANTGTLDSTVTFSELEVLSGGTGSDTLQARTTINNWVINGDESGTIDGLAFSEMETLNGGGDVDTFDVNVATSSIINGGVGADIFNLFNSSGTVNGGNDADIFNVLGTITTALNGDTGADQFNLDFGSGTVSGGANNNTYTISDNTIAVTIQGGANTDTVEYSGASAASWALTNVNAGTLNTNIVFSGVETLAGGTGADTLQGRNVAGMTWTINGDESGSVDSISFSEMETLNGGTDVDIFNVSALTSSALNGGDGADQFNLGFGSGTLNGGAGNDIFTVSDDSITATIQGGADSDTVAYSGASTVTWTLTNANAGNLSGGVGFSAVETLTGGSGSDTLQGRNVTSTWTITGDEAGAITSSVGFSEMETLTGGSASDTFNVDVLTSSVINGGDGADFFNLVADSGQINGGNQGDTFNINAINSSALNGDAGSDIFNIDFSVGTLNGGDDDDTFYVSDNTITANLQGGNATDTLENTDISDSRWVLSGTGTGSFGSTTAQGVSFDAMENLTGGIANDTFAFNNGVSTDDFDTISGGTETVADNADFSAYVGVLDIALGAGGLVEIENLIGNGANGRLQGGNQATTWNINGTNSGTVVFGSTTTGFTGFADLNGGTAVDTFIFQSTGSISGTVDGGTGTSADELIGRDTNSTYTITGANSGSVSDTGTSPIYVADFQDIETITAGSGTDNIQAQNIANVWNITGAEGGDLNGLSFNEMETLTGNNNEDQFTIGAVAVTASINGGAGADIFNLNSGANVSTPILGQGGADNFYINNLNVVATLNGGGASDNIFYTGSVAASWDISAANAGTLSNVTFTTLENVYGGGGVDTFTFSPAGSLTTIDGGGNNDVLVGRDTAGTYTLTGANTGTVNDGTQYVSFSAVESLQGGSTTDTLAAQNINNTWTINGSGSGSLAASVSFAGMEMLQGGTGVDDFSTNALANQISISGGGNTDSVSFSSGGTALWTLTSATQGNLASNLSFTDIDVLNGGSGVNTIQARDVANNWVITGNGAGSVDNRSFTNMDFLVGGSLADSFNTNVLLTAALAINGNGGGNSLTYSGSNAALWTLGGSTQGQGSLASLSFSDMQTLNGGSGVDTLLARNIANTWAITGADSGTVDGVTFTSMAYLDGGTDDDIFSFGATGSVSGDIDGGNGTDTLVGRAAATDYRVSAANAGTANAGGIYVTFNGIENLTAGAGSDTIRGRDVSNSWDITGADTGTIDGIDFSGVENLDGGSQPDSFIFSTLTSAISGLIDGRGGNDTLQGRDANSVYTLTGNQTGNVAESNVTYASFTGIEILTGGSGSDTLQARNQSNTWVVNGFNNGTVDNVSFSAIENLSGNSGQDIFTFSGLTSEISGLIDGGESSGDDDQLLLEGLTAGVVVSLGDVVIPNTLTPPNSAPTQVNADNFELIRADSGTNNAGEDANWLAVNYLDDPNLDDSVSVQIDQNGNGSWNINDGWVEILDSDVAISGSRTDFENFGSIQTGDLPYDTNAVDSIAAGSSGTPNITGFFIEGTGAGSINWVNAIGFLVVDLRENLQSVIGNGNTLLRATDSEGFDGTNNWAINGVNAGTFSTDSFGGYSLDFQGVNQIEGGSGADTFAFSAAGTLVDGSILGGGGSNIITSSSTADLVFGINALQAAVGIARYYGAAPPTQVLTNRAGIIDILNIDSVTGNASANTTLYSSDTGSFTWNIGGTSSTLVGNGSSLSFTNVDRVVGGGADDLFNVLDAVTVEMNFDGGAGNDTLDLSNFNQAFAFSIDPAIVAADVFINGIESLNLPNLDHRLYAANYDNSWTFTSENTGTLAYNDGFADQLLNFNNMANVVGNSSRDTFYFDTNGRVSGALDGGANLVTATDSLIVAGTNTEDFMFQVSGVDTGATVVDILGIEMLTANATTDNTLLASNIANTWQVTEAGNNLSYSTDTLIFSGINNLQGGTAKDDFIFDAAVVSGLVDAGSNPGNLGDSLLIQGLDNSTVHVGDRVSTDLNVLNFESYTGNGSNITLRGDDVANSWTITTADTGTLNTAQFIGFSSLTGGSASDAFVVEVNGQLQGLIDGGADPTNGVASDTLDIQALATATIVSLDSAYAAADLAIANLETVTAINRGHQLVGADANNTWVVRELNSGQVNATNFVGFANLLGRDQVDNFIFRELGDISGQVDGGSEPQGLRDIVDMSELVNVAIVVGDTTTGFINIEEYIGNNTNSSITAENIQNDWIIDSVNGGSIQDALNRNITFRDFTSIIGGADVDRFTITDTGSVTGQILAGAGDDRLTLMLGAGRDGQVNFDGGIDNDIVAVQGGQSDARFTTDYSAASNGSVSMDFGINGLSFDLNYSGVETVNDTVYTSTMTVDPVSGQTNLIQLSSLDFDIAGQAPVNFTRVQSIVLDGSQGDSLILNGLVDFVNNIELRNVYVDATNGSLRAGQNLIFDRTAGLGASADRLQIETTNLQLNNVLGASYLNITGDTNLAALTNPGGLVDILSDAGLTSTSNLQSIQSINVVADGDIRFSGVNNLSGAVRLISQNTVELNNSLTNLAEVQADNFILTARSNVTDSGAIVVNDQFTLNGASGSVVTLDELQNSFNQINLNSLGSAVLRDHSVNGVTVQGQAASGLDLIAEQMLTANDLSGSNIGLVSENGMLVTQGSLSADNSVVLQGNGVQVSGLISVANSVGGQAVEIDAGTGDVNLLAGINAAQTISGDVSISSANVTVASGANISARNLDMDVSGNITSSSNFVADDAITVLAGGDLTMQTVNPQIRMQANNISLQVNGNVQLQNINATQFNVTSNTGNISQQGDATVNANVSYSALQGAVSSTAGAELSSNGSIVDINSASMQWLGDINASQAVASLTTTGLMEIGGDLQFTNATITTGSDLAMLANSSVSSSTSLDVNTGGDLRAAAMSAGDTLTLNISGAVSDNDDQAINFSAPNLLAVSQTGFGSLANRVETATGLMDVVNTSGEVGVTNNQELNVVALINSGDIFLQNSAGNITLNNIAGFDYDVDLTGTRAAGGVIDGNYDVGNVRIEVLAGYLDAIPQVSNLNRPELIGQSVSVITRDGFGVRGRRIVVFAQDQLRVGGVNGGGGGIRPRWGFGIAPVNGLITDSDLADVGVFGSLADLFIEFVGEIDPAIFTNVTNYVYEDVSIRMPRDQLLEEEEDDDDEEAWERLEGS